MPDKSLSLLICCLIFSFFGCKKDSGPLEPEGLLIEGQTFNQTVLIDGHDRDGTIIRDCIFENIDGDGLQIRDVDNLIVEDCIFREIKEDGIRFRNSGGSDGVQILNNEIYNIDENGILAWEGHRNTVIKGNTIYNVALNKSSALAGAPHHGIYFQGPNFEISENTIYDIVNNKGNCVSVRSYGTVSKNRLYNATDHGVSYFSDHPGADGELLVENNFIYDNGSRGINLTSNGTESNHISGASLRFNTIVSEDQAPIGIDDALCNGDNRVIANINIRRDGGSLFIFSNCSLTESNNLNSDTDIGFVDFVNRDLHLISSSGANGLANGLSGFPSDDIDGDLRNPASLDAGADQLD